MLANRTIFVYEIVSWVEEWMDRRTGKKSNPIQTANFLVNARHESFFYHIAIQMHFFNVFSLYFLVKSTISLSNFCCSSTCTHRVHTIMCSVNNICRYAIEWLFLGKRICRKCNRLISGMHRCYEYDDTNRFSYGYFLIVREFGPKKGHHNI